VSPTAPLPLPSLVTLASAERRASADLMGQTWRALRPARGALALASVLLLMAMGWVALRATLPTDGAPVLTDNGYVDGLLLDPTGRAGAVRPGDVVVGIDDASVDDALSGRATSIPSFRRGSTHRYDVLRDGVRTSLVVVVEDDDVVGERIHDGAAVLMVGLVIVGVGAWAVWRRPQHPAARALLLFGAGLTTYTVFQLLGSETAMLGDRRMLFALGVGGAVGSLTIWCTALAHLALSLPEPVGFLRRRPRLPMVVYALGLVLTLGLQCGTIAAGAATLDRLAATYVAMTVLLYVLALAALGGLGRTIWRSVRDPSVRSQGALVAAGAATSLVLLLTVNIAAGDRQQPPWFPPLAFLPITAAVAAAIVRGDFLDLRATLNRALVYTVLTATLLGIYGAVVVAVGSVIGGSGLAATIPATGIVAVAFAPARALLQRAVDRLIYGQRKDPARVLTNLGRRLDAALPAEQVLPVVAETIATSLRLPYVGIRVEGGEGGRLACDRGDPTDHMETFPLHHHDTVIGGLVVAPRRGQRTLSSDDRTLLNDVARQVATAVEAARLVTELAASRSRLAIAREDERAQLRRDLHDRLGPRLVGLGLQLDTLSARVDDEHVSTAALRARAEAEEALEEIRRLARGLRPADLEDVGLVAAIETTARRLSLDDDRGWSVQVDAALHLPAIAANVASAAYQIVCEALTNAHRHSGGTAAHVRVGVSADGSRLVVEVSDNGRGFPADTNEGVGLASMRQRSAAVDGTFAVTRNDGLGITVRAELPV
jgi:signal transduction histidine kinase